VDPLFHVRDQIQFPRATLYLPRPEPQKGTEQQNSRNRHPNPGSGGALAAHG
jgi:hypothetical protein